MGVASGGKRDRRLGGFAAAAALVAVLLVAATPATALGSDDRLNDIIAMPDGGVIAVGGSDNRSVLARYAPDGALDPSFGDGGLVVRAGLGGAASAAALAPDGQIVAVGRRGNSMARYGPDGTRDRGFGDRGVAEIDFDRGNGDYDGVAPVVSPSGDIIVAGVWRSGVYGRGHVALVRVHPDGRLDRSFGDHGIAIGPTGNSPDLALRENGKVVVASDWPSAAQFTRRGTLDRGFAHNGVFRPRPGGSYYALALQPDGKVVLVGEAHHKHGPGAFPLITRLTREGAPDRRFNRHAQVPIGGPVGDNPFAYARAVAVDDAGRIYVGGGVQSCTKIGCSSYLFASRLGPNGRPDEGFADGLGVSIDLGDGGYGSSGALTPAGFVVAGAARPEDYPEDAADFALVRFDEVGVPDSAFGDGGIVTTDFDLVP
jgi:uncharacterized delta-60 repeat protein